MRSCNFKFESKRCKISLFVSTFELWKIWYALLPKESIVATAIENFSSALVSSSNLLLSSYCSCFNRLTISFERSGVMHKKFGPNTLSQKFKEVRKAFKLFGEIELQGRQSIQQAIIGCYDIYLHYNEKLIRKRCKKAGISYKLKKPMKMILMLAMRVSDDCGDERIKARIRTYVRVLRRFNSLSYDLYTAEENLGQYGIDYFAKKFRCKC